MSELMTRREFVRVSACAGAGLAVAGVTGCVPAKKVRVVETPTSRFGGETAMSKRALVGYATRTGSTVGVAEAIGKALGERGFAVDVRPLKERPSLEGYDAVVVGSAINGGAWLPEAESFVEINASKLAEVPVAAFCVHIMNAGDTEKASRKRHAYLDKVRSAVTLVDEGYFMGKGPTADETSFIERWAFRAFGGSGEGDCRDWEAIGSWAEQVPV